MILQEREHPEPTALCASAPESKSMTDAAPFSSECPHCGHERVQPGYLRDELAQLLSTGAEIEAYCSNCDESWFISVEERADLARALARPPAKR
jgi:hypothetical protein